MSKEPDEYLDWLCEQLAYEWTRIPAAREISKNHVLYGAFVEGMVRQFIKRSVAPLRVSTGTILHEKNVGEMGPQLDAIIWHPSPSPPIIEAGEFAVVPRLAAIAYLEVKASNYDRKVGTELFKKLKPVDELIPNTEWLRPDLQERADRALGIVCVHSPGVRDTKLEKLIEEKKVVVMTRRERNKKNVDVDRSGVALLSRFLNLARLRARLLDGTSWIRDPKELREDQKRRR